MKKLFIYSMLCTMCLDTSYCKRYKPTEEQLARDLYEYGYHLYNKKEYGKAFTCIQKAAERKHADACAMLGGMYFYGRGCTKNYDNSFKYSKLGEEYGSSVAMRNLGFLHYYGHGCQKNRWLSKRYYEQASEHGSKMALIDLGDLYYRGEYDEIGERYLPNYDAAFYYYEQAAQLGYPIGLQKLGQMYYKGYGCKSNYIKAIQCYEEALNKGYVNVLRDLGDLYYNRNYDDDDLEIAFNYYEQASDLGDPISTKYIAEAYYKGDYPYQEDPNMSSEYYDRAIELFDQEIAEGDTIDAPRKAGILLYNGINGVQCYEKALKYFKITIDAGEDDGKCAYYAGCCYYAMGGHLQDAHYYLKQASNGDNEKYAYYAKEFLAEKFESNG